MHSGNYGCSNRHSSVHITVKSSCDNLIPVLCILSKHAVYGNTLHVHLLILYFNISVPDGPPENIAVSAVSPFAIEVEWSTPTTPNGVIIHYTVYSNGTVIAEVEGTLMSYLYHGLVPYQQVSISVSASTEIGEGPRSTEVTNRTQESG